MVPYEVVFFDLDHTLVDTRRQYDLGLHEALEALYGEALPTGFQARFMHHHEQLWVEYDAREITMDDLRRERFLRAWRDFGVERTEAEAAAFQRRYDETLERTLFVFPGTHEMLQKLQSCA
ncbi:MAG: HAD hydrolase-like protein, partial [Alicyclobacillus herbarius]|uniref:HAD family hydrolase n=1 Tax=Alicyclobacillus herbarius TaxID=122960 RepID=UPI0023552A66